MSHWSDRYAGSPESRDQTGGLYSPLWSANMSDVVSKISQIQVCWFNAVGYVRQLARAVYVTPCWSSLFRVVAEFRDPNVYPKVFTKRG